MAPSKERLNMRGGGGGGGELRQHAGPVARCRARDAAKQMHELVSAEPQEVNSVEYAPANHLQHASLPRRTSPEKRSMLRPR